MELETYVEEIRDQVVRVADSGDDEGRAQTERLLGPLDAALRLALQHALADAADEITCELAPGSVELRVRGRELAFVVSQPADEQPVSLEPPPPEDGEIARINVRMPEHLKARVEKDAAAQRISINEWLVRAANAALRRTETSSPRGTKGPQRYQGWAK